MVKHCFRIAEIWVRFPLGPNFGAEQVAEMAVQFCPGLYTYICIVKQKKLEI